MAGAKLNRLGEPTLVAARCRIGLMLLPTPYPSAKPYSEPLESHGKQFVSTQKDLTSANPDTGDLKEDDKGHSTSIPMVGSSSEAYKGTHFVFCLDESGSMSGVWQGVVNAYAGFLISRPSGQATNDLVSVVQFDHRQRVTVERERLRTTAQGLPPCAGGGTCFGPALDSCHQLLSSTPAGYAKKLLFMSDGCPSDVDVSYQAMRALRAAHPRVDVIVVPFTAHAHLVVLGELARLGSGVCKEAMNIAELQEAMVALSGADDAS